MLAIIILSIIIIQTNNLLAASIRAKWNAVTQDIEGNPENIKGYTLFWGLQKRPSNVTHPNDTSFSYDSNLDITGTQATISGLKPNTTYYFAVCAQDQAGNISNYSSEVEFKIQIECEIDSDCKDPDKKYCIENKCVECTQESHCKQDEICYNNECIKGGGLCEPCQTGAQCLDGICLNYPTANYCGRLCQDHNDCPREEGFCCFRGACYSGTLRCPAQEIECCEHNECQEKELCLQGKCREVGCTKDEHCPENKKCLNFQCVEKIECTKDEDCQSKGQGWYCENNICLPPKEICLTDKDCKPDEKCLGGKCIKTGCITDKDCPEGELCEAGKCIEAECITNNHCQEGFVCIDKRCVSTKPPDKDKKKEACGCYITNKSNWLFVILLALILLVFKRRIK
jgi:Cys-rich repeat protein